MSEQRHAVSRRASAERPQETVRRPPRHAGRPRSLGTKLTEDEHAVIVAAAGTQRVSEWVRHTVLAAAVAEPADGIILAELLALRAIVLTLQFSAAAGEPITAEAMQRLIDRADRDKLPKAHARLAAPSTRRSS